MSKLLVVKLIILYTGAICLAALSDADRADLVNETLKNPGFESGKANWQINGGTATVETTEKLFGKQSLKIALSSYTGNILTQTNTPEGKVQGTNRAVGAWLKTTQTGMQLCALQGSTEIDCQNIPAMGVFVRVISTHVGPSSGAIGLRIKSTTSVTGDLYIDGAAEGINNGITEANIVTELINSGPVTITAVTTNPTKGTTAADRHQWRRVGQYLEGFIDYRQSATGTTGSGDYLFGIPSICTVDTTKVAVYTGSSNTDYANNIGEYAGGNSAQVLIGTAVLYDSTKFRLLSHNVVTGSTLYVSSTQSPLNSAGVNFNINYKVPCVGWTASNTVRMDQTNYDWTSYTPAFNGLGTPTSVECQHKRAGSDLLLRCKFAAGTTTAAEMRVGLPNNLTSADTAKIPSIQLAGDVTTSLTGGSQSIKALIEPSVTYLTFGYRDAAVSGFTKQNGNFFTSGNLISVTARVPILNWTENLNAPMIRGGVTAPNTNNTVYSFFAEFGGASNPSNCTSSPCTLYASSGNLTNVTRTSTGIYVVNVPSGVCASNLVCTPSGEDGATYSRCVTRQGTASTTTTSTIACQDTSAVRDSKVAVSCWCNRL